MGVQYGSGALSVLEVLLDSFFSAGSSVVLPSISGCDANDAVVDAADASTRSTKKIKGDYARIQS